MNKRDAKIVRIKRINEQAVPLPQGFIDWMDRRMPVFILYESGKKEGTCTHCGAVSKYKKLRYGAETACPECRKRGTAKTYKRIPKTISRKFVYMQNIQNGVMCRFVEREWNFGPAQGEIEKVCRETLRAAVEQGRRQYWYEQKGYGFGWYENNMCWSTKTRNSPMVRCAGSGGWSWRYEGLGEPQTYGRTYRSVIKKSLFRHFPEMAEEMITRVKEERGYSCGVSAFLDVYDQLHRHPGVQILYQYGLQKLAIEYIGDPHLRLNNKGHKPHEILEISKELLRAIKKNGLGQDKTERCQIMQKATKDVELIIRAAEALRTDEIRLFFKQLHMPVKKTMKYLEKTPQHRTYCDYLRMAEEAGSDMADEFVLFPQDLEAAHDTMLKVVEEIRKRKKKEEDRKKAKDIERVYKKIKASFSFEDDTFFIRPVKTFKELVREGQAMHHCVGYAGYDKKIIKEESYILFLRKKETPDESFYTVEVDRNYNILQRHGKYNKEGEEVKEVDAFLELFRKEAGHVSLNHAG